MVKKMKTAIINKKGNTIIEFALVMPMFMLLMMAVFDIGTYFQRRSILDQATNLAARLAFSYGAAAWTTNEPNCQQKIKQQITDYTGRLLPSNFTSNLNNNTHITTRLLPDGTRLLEITISQPNRSLSKMLLSSLSSSGLNKLQTISTYAAVPLI